MHAYYKKDDQSAWSGVVLFLVHVALPQILEIKGGGGGVVAVCNDFLTSKEN